MQPLSLEPHSPDGSQSENNSPVAGRPSVSRKRDRDEVEEDKTISVDPTERPSKITRINRSPFGQNTSVRYDEVFSRQDTSLTEVQHEERPDLPDDSMPSNEVLDSNQRHFVRQWYTTFAKERPTSMLSDDSMSALATLIQAHPQLVVDYITSLCPDDSPPNQLAKTEQSSPILASEYLSSRSQKPYFFSAANEHLPQATLDLVNKFITSCHRTRPRTDRRRSVNSGPYRCTFGCGYHTKRTFDWRRHEETHEPQELWLCTLCQKHSSTRDDGGETDSTRREPFLVSRKDKFLRHARECHTDWVAERVLELSRVDYRPRGGLNCPTCGVKSRSWDERCRHVLGHFEDEIEQGLKRVDGISVSLDEGKSYVEGSVTSGSVEAASSEDEGPKLERRSPDAAN